MDDFSKEEEVKDVYANFGFAIYAAQCLEHELVNDFIYLDLIPREMPLKHSLAWEDVVDTFASKQFKNTLGHMIKHLEKVTEVPPSLLLNLAEALKIRNWLVHDYFKERAHDFLSSEGRKDMVIELQKAASVISEADEELSHILIPVKEKYGITDEVLRKVEADMFKKGVK